MRFSGVSAIAIWNAATRTLTNASPMVLTQNVIFTSLAISSSVDLRPASGQIVDGTVTVKTGATATAASNISIFDGTTTAIIATTAAAANAVTFAGVVSINTVGAKVTNTDAAVAAQYAHHGFRWIL